MSYNPYRPCPQPWHPQPWQPPPQLSSALPPPTKPPGLSTSQAIGIALGAWLLFWTVIGGYYLAAAMVTYAYDQIDQARTELNAVSK